MQRSVKAKTRSGAQRDLFTELRESIESLASNRKGKRTFCTHMVEVMPAPKITQQG